MFTGVEQVQDVTQAIKDSRGIFSTVVQDTLNAQVHCKNPSHDNTTYHSSGDLPAISWSGQAEMGERKPCIDGSLLALGNRAGRIILMRLTQSVVASFLFMSSLEGHVTGGTMRKYYYQSRRLAWQMTG